MSVSSTPNSSPSSLATLGRMPGLPSRAIDSAPRSARSRRSATAFCSESVTPMPSASFTSSKRSRLSSSTAPVLPARADWRSARSIRSAKWRRFGSPVTAS
jgi:hypothetical protein